VIPVLYMGLIWYSSNHPSDYIVSTGIAIENDLKEKAHLVIFAVLYLMIVFALYVCGKLSVKNSNIAAIIAIIYGFLDEAHQYFIPFRSATLNDLLKNSLGVSVAWFLMHIVVFGKFKMKRKV